MVCRNLSHLSIHLIPCLLTARERINLIRKLSTDAKTVGEDDAAVIQYAVINFYDSLTFRYARTKNTLKVFQEQINTKIETIFMNQREALEKDTDPSEEEDLLEVEYHFIPLLLFSVFLLYDS